MYLYFPDSPVITLFVYQDMSSQNFEIMDIYTTGILSVRAPALTDEPPVYMASHPTKLHISYFAGCLTGNFVSISYYLYLLWKQVRPE
jgi:hypothetical protein